MCLSVPIRRHLRLTDLWCLWLALGLGSLTLGEDRPMDLDSLLNEARTLINEGQATAAIEKLKASHQTSNPKVVSLLGVAYYHSREYVRAIEQLARSVDTMPHGSLERQEAVQVLGLSKSFPAALPNLSLYSRETRTGPQIITSWPMF